jgi:hypothetical protein
MIAPVTGPVEVCRFVIGSSQAFRYLVESKIVRRVFDGTRDGSVKTWCDVAILQPVRQCASPFLCG